MAAIDLTKYGITGTTEIVHNPSYEMLFEEETKANDLADRFVKNFAKYEGNDAGKALVSAGPQK